MCNSIIEFKTTPEVYAASKRIETIIGNYFTYNCALQIWLAEGDSVKKGFGLLNYMPRHGETTYTTDVELFSKPLTKKQLKDFCLVNTVVLKNLGKQFTNFANAPSDVQSVTYPNVGR